MDFEDGISLSQLLREGKTFDEAGLMSVIRPVAEGLERAHLAGVFHRDIKPANILIAKDGRPVLIDFGSARFDAGQVTSTKVTFYTPPYAALEQYVRTFPQGAWTDIYALGVTMHQCITGEKPAEVLERLHGGDHAPLAGRNIPGFSPGFLRAVDAAMGIKPEDRPQSITAWLALFEPGAVWPAPRAPATVTGQDEATRIASPQPQASVAAAPPQQAAPTAAHEEAEASAERKRPKGRAGLLIAAGVAALVLAGGGIAALRPWDKPASAALPVAASPAVKGVDTAALPTKLQALAAAAATAKRPAAELKALDEGLTKLNELIASKAASVGVRRRHREIVAPYSRKGASHKRSQGARQRPSRDAGLRPPPTSGWRRCATMSGEIGLHR